jgi:hypothetical protein
LPINALLVDGVGRTREMSLSQQLHSVRVPLSRQFSMEPHRFADGLEIGTDAEFDYVGTLPDGRIVYGYVFSAGPQYAMWHADAAWSQIAEPHVLDIVKREVSRKIEAIETYNHPVTLFDETSTDARRGLKTRTVIGIARRP